MMLIALLTYVDSFFGGVCHLLHSTLSCLHWKTSRGTETCCGFKQFTQLFCIK